MSEIFFVKRKCRNKVSLQEKRVGPKEAFESKKEGSLSKKWFVTANASSRMPYHRKEKRDGASWEEKSGILVENSYHRKSGTP